MATTSLQLPMVVQSFPSSSSSSSSSENTNLGLWRFRTATQRLNCKRSSKFPMIPQNPNDPFLKKLGSLVEANPDYRPDLESGNPPFLDLFEGPTSMASPAQVERSVRGRSRRSRRGSPPDLASLLLDGRVVYLSMPLVPAVTELIVMQLMYLQWEDPKAPVSLYINSTGTTRDDGETIALETEGYAIYDAMSMMSCDVETLCVGAAVGQACLLLAAGKKGRRFMMPNSQAMITQPSAPPTGLMRADFVRGVAKQLERDKKTLVELFAKHTGNSVELVEKLTRKKLYMDAKRAIELGVIDKILWRGQHEAMKDIVSAEEYERITALVKEGI